MSNEWFKSGSGIWGCLGTGTHASFNIDSAFVPGTSGGSWCVRFVAPAALSNGTVVLYAFFPASSGLGSPTDVRAAVWSQASGDDDRPNVAGAAIATSSAVDCSGYVNQGTGSWVTFTISNVTLSALSTYYIIIDNRTENPASHYPTFTTRGTGYTGGFAAQNSILQICTNTDGYTTDPTLASVPSACVVKIGSLILGSPWVYTATHASNANDRGMRIQFDEDMVVSGCRIHVTSSLFTGLEINLAVGGSNIATFSLADPNVKGQGIILFNPITLSAGVAYDFVFTYSGSTGGSYYTMGQASPPGDVVACKIYGTTYVDGDTPGSYSTDNTSMWPFTLFLDNAPAIDTPPASAVITSDTVRGVTGTFDEAARNTDPGIENVKDGITYKIANEDLEGTYVGDSAPGTGGGVPRPNTSGNMQS